MKDSNTNEENFQEKKIKEDQIKLAQNMLSKVKIHSSYLNHLMKIDKINFNDLNKSRTILLKVMALHYYLKSHQKDLINCFEYWRNLIEKKNQKSQEKYFEMNTFGSNRNLVPSYNGFDYDINLGFKPRFKIQNQTKILLIQEANVISKYSLCPNCVKTKKTGINYLNNIRTQNQYNQGNNQIDSPTVNNFPSKINAGLYLIGKTNFLNNDDLYMSNNESNNKLQNRKNSEGKFISRDAILNSTFISSK